MASDLPATMKAVFYTEHGEAAKVLQWRDDALVRTECADGEALIKVHAAAINPVDNAIAAGYLKPSGNVYYCAVDRALAGDVAGVVVKAGKDAIVATGIDASGNVTTKPAEIGDVVFGACREGYGSFSEYVVVNSKQLVIKPPELSFADAASIPLASLTAYSSLTVHSSVQPGHKVLVLGGSGGVGTFAIQIAKALGAATVASTSSDTALLARLGADVPINYREESWSEKLAGHDYDIVYASVPEKGAAPAWEGAQRVLKAGGTYVALLGNSFPKDDDKDLHGKDLVTNEELSNPKVMKKVYDTSASHTLASTGLTFTTDTKSLLIITELVLSGKIKPLLHNDRTFPFSEAGWQDLFQVNQSGRAKGKLVFDMTASA